MYNIECSLPKVKFKQIIAGVSVLGILLSTCPFSKSVKAIGQDYDNFVMMPEYTVPVSSGNAYAKYPYSVTACDAYAVPGSPTYEDMKDTKFGEIMKLVTVEDCEDYVAKAVDEDAKIMYRKRAVHSLLNKCIVAEMRESNRLHLLIPKLICQENEFFLNDESQFNQFVIKDYYGGENVSAEDADRNLKDLLRKPEYRQAFLINNLYKGFAEDPYKYSKISQLFKDPEFQLTEEEKNNYRDIENPESQYKCPVTSGYAVPVTSGYAVAFEKPELYNVDFAYNVLPTYNDLENTKFGEIMKLTTAQDCISYVDSISDDYLKDKYRLFAIHSLINKCVVSDLEKSNNLDLIFRQLTPFQNIYNAYGNNKVFIDYFNNKEKWSDLVTKIYYGGPQINAKEAENNLVELMRIPEFRKSLLDQNISIYEPYKCACISKLFAMEEFKLSDEEMRNTKELMQAIFVRGLIQTFRDSESDVKEEYSNLLKLLSKNTDIFKVKYIYGDSVISNNLLDGLNSCLCYDSNEVKNLVLSQFIDLIDELPIQTDYLSNEIISYCYKGWGRFIPQIDQELKDKINTVLNKQTKTILDSNLNFQDYDTAKISIWIIAGHRIKSGIFDIKFLESLQLLLERKIGPSSLNIVERIFDNIPKKVKCEIIKSKEKVNVILKLRDILKDRGLEFGLSNKQKNQLINSEIIELCDATVQK